MRSEDEPSRRERIMREDEVLERLGPVRRRRVKSVVIGVPAQSGEMGVDAGLEVGEVGGTDCSGNEEAGEEGGRVVVVYD